MPKNDHYVIIGNGPAGNRAADVLRENDTDARVTIISDESFSYYYRHMLPKFAVGTKTEEELIVRPFTVYKEKRIRMRLGQKVERIDPENRVLYLKHMEKVNFTKLILAVGGTPRILPSLTSFKEHFMFMSSYSDAVKLKPALEGAKRIMLLGGDLTSLGFMKALMAMEKKIVFNLCTECFLPLELTEEMSIEICESLKKKNIDAYEGDPVAQIDHTKGVYHVSTESGRTFECDLLCSFMGLVPNIGFVQGSGIDTESGVLVDDHLRTNYPDIYACGDCAQIYNPDLKNYWVSVGWKNAEKQGEAAALNLLGDSEVIKPMTQCILEVEGLKVNTSWWKQF